MSPIVSGRLALNRALSSRQGLAVVTPARVAAAYVVLIAATGLRIPQRSLSEASNSPAEVILDAQVIVVLPAFGLVGGWFLAVLARGRGAADRSAARLRPTSRRSFRKYERARVHAAAT